jgi:uncharacterized protein (DUF1684 family)
MRKTLLTLAALAVSSIGYGAARPEKGATAFLKIPIVVLKPTMKSGGMMGLGLPSLEFTGRVSVANGAVSVNDHANWQSLGFPSLAEYRLSKIKIDGDASVLEMKPASGAGRALRLFLPAKPDFAYGQIFATKDEIAAYRDQVYRAMSEQFFTGPLKAIPEERKLALVTFADRTAGGASMGSTTYKDNLYLAIDLGQDDSVYNELKLNQAQRVARVLNDSLLSKLKASAKEVATVDALHGIKLWYTIPHRDFAKEYAAASEDRLELYAPREQIKKFAEADITSQQFIDGCVVIVNDNRIQVPLASD